MSVKWKASHLTTSINLFSIFSFKLVIFVIIFYIIIKEILIIIIFTIVTHNRGYIIEMGIFDYSNLYRTTQCTP